MYLMGKSPPIDHVQFTSKVTLIRLKKMYIEIQLEC